MTLELVVEDADDGQLLRQGLGARLANELPVRNQIEGRKVQAQEFGQAINELRHDRTDLHLPGKGLPHFDHCPLQFQPLGKKEPVDRPLEALPEGLEKEHDGESEDHREVR